ncbi:hypothetical protein F4802DRAFT_532596 [Xylaria palmicola]|nr:hypothetical protein F4802DRAFT_532596 [Xylaria palmicola]
MSQMSNDHREPCGQPTATAPAPQCHKRCCSLALPRRDVWVPQEKPHALGEIPSRSISLGSGHYHGLTERLQPEPLDPEFDTAAMLWGRKRHNEDEEDRRAGVPTTYSQGPASYIFDKSMQRAVEAEFQRLKRYCGELSATLRAWEGGYTKLRRLFFDNAGLDWTLPQWREFLDLEDAFCNLQREVFDVQEEMQCMNAQLCLFASPPTPLSGHRDAWVRGRAEDDTAGWPGGEQRGGWGGYPVLEWNGVDYNLTSESWV